MQRVKDTHTQPQKSAQRGKNTHTRPQKTMQRGNIHELTLNPKKNLKNYAKR